MMLKYAKDPTLVFWDIKTCPVPSACDASRVAPCIRRFLKDSGYSGPVTIVAVGLLTDVPSDVLQAVSSTGIVLNHVSYGSVGILSTIYDWINFNDPPTNIMFISSNPSLHIPANKGYNIFRLFPCDSPNPESLWKDFLLEASLKEDKCTETGEPARWLCSVCFKVNGQGFENFTTHLNTLEHAQEASYMDERAKSVMVFWDINRFPVPPGYDPRRVGPCIKRFLKNEGYSGRITIVVIGLLSDVPVDVLRDLSSTTGIVLRNVLRGSKDFVNFVYVWTYRVSSPAHMMLIGPCPEDIIRSLQKLGYNIIQLFRRNVVSLWKKFLLKDSKTLEEDKCSETGEPVPWVCSACRDNICGQGFENFTMHLHSKEHGLEMSKRLSVPWSYEAGDQAHPESATMLRASRRMRRRVTYMRMKKPRTG
ncbi:NYN domain limkain-b1-type [Arabidopsis suecica]|uniref:NYN domain limkain-b1-type n=1 Tax=Arabidopsis suecica TaxID=45249 RepID=A0A8T2AP41_ARASU|nr:NYN domain limkain-b1-type [Arabidopsis suecica]